MKNSVVSIILAALLVASGIFLAAARKSNSRLNNGLKDFMAKVDSLKSEGRVLNKQMDSLKLHSDSLSNKSNSLEKSLTQLKVVVAAKDQSYSRLNQSMTEAGKKNNDLLIQQKRLEGEISALKTSNLKLGTENKDITSKLALIQDSNKQLTDELAAAKLSVKDNIQISSLTKNGTLNVKGRKIKRIETSVSLPAETKSLSFKIFDPNGTELSDQIGTFTHKTTNENGKSMKLEITYLLSKKIGTGMYRIEILSENKHAGNLLMTFR